MPQQEVFTEKPKLQFIRNFRRCNILQPNGPKATNLMFFGGVFFKAVFSQIIYLEELDLVVGGA